MSKPTRRTLLAAALVAAGMMLNGTARAAEATPKWSLGTDRLAPGKALEITEGAPDWRTLFKGDFTMHTRVRPDGERFAEGTLFSWRQFGKELDTSAAMGVQDLNRSSMRLLYFFADVSQRFSEDMPAPDRQAASRKVYVAVPLWPDVEPLGEKGWHDVIVRTKGGFIEMLVDGVVRVKKNVAACPIVKADNMFPKAVYRDRNWTAVGGEVDGKLPFPGEVASFQAWDRALDDDEIKKLSGGVFQGDYDRPFGWNQLGLFPNDWSYEKRKEWSHQGTGRRPAQMEQARAVALER
jgi:hypothetical protein